MPAGQPTKYREEYCKEMLDFFGQELTEVVQEQVATNSGVKVIEKVIPRQLPTFEGYARLLNVHSDTLKAWRDAHPKFSVTYKKCKELQKEFISHNGMMGHYNTTFAIFFAKCNLGWNDKAAETPKDLTVNLNYSKKDKKDDSTGSAREGDSEEQRPSKEGIGTTD